MTPRAGESRQQFNKRRRRAWARGADGKRAAAIWRKNNPDKMSAQERRNDARDRRVLSDKYVKRILVKRLSGVSYSDIPRVLVEAKRAQLKLHRLINQNGKA